MLLVVSVRKELYLRGRIRFEFSHNLSFASIQLRRSLKTGEGLPICKRLSTFFKIKLFRTPHETWMIHSGSQIRSTYV